MPENFNETVKVQIVETLPGLSSAEIGEFYYDKTNSKLALRTVAGWVTFAKDE